MFWVCSVVGRIVVILFFIRAVFSLSTLFIIYDPCLSNKLFGFKTLFRLTVLLNNSHNLLVFFFSSFFRNNSPRCEIYIWKTAKDSFWCIRSQRNQLSMTCKICGNRSSESRYVCTVRPAPQIFVNYSLSHSSTFNGPLSRQTTAFWKAFIQRFLCCWIYLKNGSFSIAAVFASSALPLLCFWWWYEGPTPYLNFIFILHAKESQI